MSGIPIRLRLTLWFVAVLAVVLAGLGVFVADRLRASLVDEVDRSLTRTAADLSEGYRVEGMDEFVAGTREAVAAPGSRTLGAQLVRFGFVDQGPGADLGTVVRFAGTQTMAARLLGVEAAAAGRAGATFVGSTRLAPSRAHLRYIAVPVSVAADRGALVVAEPLDEVDDAVRRTIVLLGIGGGAGLLLAGFGAWAVAGRALRPVNRMTTHAGAIGIGELDQRVPVPAARDELRRLAQTFNAMLDRLEHGVRARERLIADASHELRAPLAALRAELDVSLRHDRLADGERERLERLRAEAARLGRVVDNLFTLARIDEGRLDLLPTRQDLRELAEAAAGRTAAAAAAAGVTVDVSGGAALVRCDRDRIEQVIGNLLDNAIGVSPAGGRVTLRTEAAGASVRLAVSDQGPGVPPPERERIFERFARLDASRGRGGAGLGLAISCEIAEAHGGHLAVEDGVPGGGSVFVLTLPAGAARSA